MDLYKYFVENQVAIKINMENKDQNNLIVTIIIQV